jgi:hypothetical protein
MTANNLNSATSVLVQICGPLTDCSGDDDDEPSCGSAGILSGNGGRAD